MTDDITLYKQSSQEFLIQRGMYFIHKHQREVIVYDVSLSFNYLRHFLSENQEMQPLKGWYWK